MVGLRDGRIFGWRSIHGHNDLAFLIGCTKMPKCFRHFRERIRPIDP